MGSVLCYVFGGEGPKDGQGLVQWRACGGPWTLTLFASPADLIELKVLLEDAEDRKYPENFLFLSRAFSLARM